MKRVIVLIPALMIAISLFAQVGENRGLYEVVYSADKEGNQLSGNLEDLIEYIQNGNPVRVGWELRSVWSPDTTTTLTHWTDGGFVSVQRGHVFAQIRGIFGQGFAHISSPPSIFLSTDVPNSWVGVLGTDGSLRSKFYKAEWMKDMTEEQIKQMELMKVKTMWAVMKE